MKNRTLFFGDNLEILRKKITNESFDLIYLDPPFNSNRNYNVIYKEGLQDSPAQIKAFDDSWHWTHETKHIFDQLVTKSNENISNLMLALEKVIKHNDVMAYLVMMTVRLIELHRVLKKSGTLYLHCDPTASHYLKIVLDMIFGKKNFRNEIVWCYRGGGSPRNDFGSRHDVIFRYSKTDNYKFYADPVRVPYQAEGINRKDNAMWGKHKGTNKIYKPHPKGKIPEDWWQMNILNANDPERLGYPTQKPERLLERIIKASSKNGDWILDPFCGCGTTVAVAERLKRNWVGIDITALAINLIKKRLKDQFSLGSKQIDIDGYPKDLTGARELAKKDPFAFEYWALDLIEAMPAKSKNEEKMRGADKGIDGIVTIYKGRNNGDYEYGKIIVQVKSGHVQRNQIATLKSDVAREKADGGIFITLEKPTQPMQSEAVDAGTFTVSFGNKEFPKIQILTVEELLRGKKPDVPLGFPKNYHKEAKSVEVEDDENQSQLNF